jgi:uncharacterized metal-binding protein
VITDEEIERRKDMLQSALEAFDALIQADWFGEVASTSIVFIYEDGGYAYGATTDEDPEAMYDVLHRHLEIYEEKLLRGRVP